MGEWPYPSFEFQPFRRTITMKRISAHFSQLAGRIDTRTIQLALLVVSLGLLAIGAGAPAGGGGGLPGCGG
jgi:hypothetical protein